ncbi:hypothetical protein F5879DRAFT_951115 [Lentinula edodes]|nr:hypothetical protein F5879DRAFT_951115 [Lentinula edodes]
MFMGPSTIVFSLAFEGRLVAKPLASGDETWADQCARNLAFSLLQILDSSQLELSLLIIISSSILRQLSLGEI